MRARASARGGTPSGTRPAKPARGHTPASRHENRAINSAARVLPSHGRSQRFKSSIAHQDKPPPGKELGGGSLSLLARMPPWPFGVHGGVHYFSRSRRTRGRGRVAASAATYDGSRHGAQAAFGRNPIPQMLPSGWGTGILLHRSASTINGSPQSYLLLRYESRAVVAQRSLHSERMSIQEGQPPVLGTECTILTGCPAGPTCSS
jgi:hypothetical protein